jgi:DNA-directed RNA polymerase specialized sigma24 family protein
MFDLWLCGLKYREIAATVPCSLNTVRKTLYRARRKVSKAVLS